MIKDPTPAEDAAMQDAVWRMLESQYEQAVANAPRPFVIHLPAEPHDAGDQS